ncbi:ATP-binding cassette domain-containing protein [Novosphingobium bradum]|uniref:ATP-binding cassette domain-containing protein n=1 Tax=Novosphingobium bradum TaxID=1737444 RepID=A0ABV7ITU2_9SPHN
MAAIGSERPFAALGGLLRSTGSVGAALGLGLLSAVSALTEGLGLVLLVPMVAMLGASAPEGAGGLAAWLRRIGFAPGLEALLALFVALVAVRGLVGAVRDVAALRLEARVVDRLRLRAWRALAGCDWKVLSTLRASDSASLLITNVDRIGAGLNQVIVLGIAAATLASIGLAALAIAPLVALAMVAGGGAILFAYRGMRRRAGALGEQLNAAYRAIHATLAEGLGALRQIKSFGREEASARATAAAFAGLRETQVRYLRDSGLARASFQAVGAALLAALVWLAIRQWHLGAAAILPTVALFARALPLLGTVQDSWQNWSHDATALVEADRAIAWLEAAAEDGGPDAAAPRLSAATRGADGFAARLPAIALAGVSVIPPAREAPSLDAITLDLPPGSLTLLAGPSGAGKSTLADVLAGLLTPDAGRFTIDGQPVTGALRRAWRERVAYVQQEPVLFHASVRDNLLWADGGADEARLRECLAAASARFVFDLPAGLDTVVGDRGTRLSGGERQRIALARGLLRAPELLILDEATSALDAANEAMVAAAIAALKGRMTIVVIGHGGALAALADRRLTLDRGRLVDGGGGDGSQASLIADDMLATKG